MHRFPNVAACYASTRGMVALVATAMFLVVACDDGGGNGDGASDKTTTTTAKNGGGSSDDLKALDYSAALFTVEDLQGLVPGDYVTADEGSLAGSQLRALCGEGQHGPEGVTGDLLELQDADTTLSFTTSVDAFASEDEAKQAFTISRDIAKPCENYITQGDSFERASAPGIVESGDEAFDLFAVKTDTGLLVGDHIVRQGQFVFDVRMVRAGNSAFSEGVVATAAEAADKKFLDWVEEEAPG